MVLPFLALAVMAPSQSVTDLVDPFIGTGGTGHTFPGPVMPHGMVQLSPDTELDDWQHCSGYHHDDTSIAGFSITHMSGTGVALLGNFMVAATVGEVKLTPGRSDTPGSGYRSRFDHADESARPGYYKVKLKDYDILAELTASDRVGIEKYTFPKTEAANLIFEITSQLGGQDRIDSSAKWVSPTEIEGSVTMGGWARGCKYFFVAQLSQSATKFGIVADRVPVEGKTEASGKIKTMEAWATFDTRTNQVVTVKMALSNVDIAGARKNLKAEARSWDFTRYVRAADRAWAKQLDGIKVAGGSDAQKRQLYTAMYHAYTQPNLFQDVDGRYQGMDRKIHNAIKGQTYYHLYSLWDTYRAAHPLYQLLNPSMNAQLVNGLLERYRVRHELPVWEVASSETGIMIGDPAVPVVCNAVIGGAPVDTELAMKAVVDTLERPRGGQKWFLQYGYVPCDKDHESVSKTLEFSYANGAAAEMAEYLGKHELASKLWKRAQGYRYVFDPKEGLMCPRTSDGAWVKDYNPKRLDYNPRYVTEGNSWQYNWLVMHDVPGLVGLYGGKENAVQKLSETFDVKNLPIGDQPDVSGLIGQYAQGNEPSHHTPYMFTAFGRPDLSARYVRESRDGLYSDKVDGLPGNDDCGQMSAWWVFSALGFYPVDPASASYMIGIPRFPEATLRLENGKVVHITTKNLDLDKGYPKEVRWNGKPLTDWKVKHSDIVQGGTLEFIG